ncbi:MAG: aminotransferase class IV family protein, partial [Candidatus Omnitrophica bacterium]|nr:aminotransferase class IV family protein [Candidatus Omnitrophota bacterium]
PPPPPPPPPASPRAPFEILWCNEQGLLTEGTVSNLFLVRRGQLLTPPVWGGALPGVVRQAVCRLARRLKISVEETPVTRHELYTAEEAFVTNSLVGVVAIRVADGRRVGTRCPGSVTRRLQRAYDTTLRKGRSPVGTVPGRQ